MILRFRPWSESILGRSVNKLEFVYGRVFYKRVKNKTAQGSGLGNGFTGSTDILIDVLSIERRVKL